MGLFYTNKSTSSCWKGRGNYQRIATKPVTNVVFLLKLLCIFEDLHVLTCCDFGGNLNLKKKKDPAQKYAGHRNMSGIDRRRGGPFHPP